MLDFALCAITNLFRIYLIYHFVETFLGKPERSKVTLLGVCASYYIGNIALYWMFHAAWINLTCNLIGISAIVFLFTKSIKLNIFITISITLINIGCDILATLPYIHFEDGQKVNQVYEILTDFYILICWFLIKKIITIRENVEHYFKISLISVPICSTAIITFMTYSDSCEELDTVVVGICLLIINFFMFYLYNQLLHSMTREFEAKLLEQKNKSYSNQLNVIMQSAEKTRALRHDMKHHINELIILANKYKSEEISLYLTKMDAFLHNPDEIVISGNLEIDSVLNYMLKKAQEELTTVNVHVVLPEHLKHSFDINVLLGNLLENAIEASKQTESKYLDVDITLKKGILFVQITNSYIPIGSSQKNTKNKFSIDISKSKKHYGLGLKNVKRIVEAYNGNMEITKSDNLFIVNVMLYTSENV